MLDRALYRGAPERLAGRTRTVAGVRVYERVAERKRAPTAVFVHGVGVSGRYLLPTAGRLAARCSVFVPDLPGFGRSGRPLARPTVAGLADALEAWLAAAGIHRPDVVVGHSFGCQVAVELAARRADPVARLVLVAPTADPRARSLPRQGARLAIDLLREPLALWAIEGVDAAVHLAKSGPGAFLDLVRDRVEEKLARVAAPTLVVAGGRDPIVPPRWVRDVAAALPRGHYAELSLAPHASVYTAPGALTGLILGFLAEPDAR